MDHRPLDTCVLRDGCVVRVLEMRPGHQRALLSFLRGLCADSRTSRFLAPCVDLERSASILADVDGTDRFGLVATGPGGSVIGHAGYARIDGHRAEAAVVVADAYRRRGLGTLLLGRLAGAATDRGIDEFVAEVLPDNGPIVTCIRRSFPLNIRYVEGARILEFPTAPRTQPRSTEPAAA